ncbi:hypothetical protein [Marinobacter vinifirmus]|uniref:hypothetical protein n=1 Tax=Marinobacter vinifirmus TaxID=355591 RepID=UPI0023570183|nr:hypothetical protein [Marinobacter vinifirmus]
MKTLDILKYVFTLVGAGMLLFGSGDLHVFRSDNLWFDPSNHIERGTVPVLVGESNLNRYWVDTSFMPKLAG